MEVSYIELEEGGSSVNICRCCNIFSSEAMDSIFECVFEDVELHEILNLLAPISIEADDGFSQFICETCKSNAIEAYCFRTTCISTNEIIRAPVEEVSELKTEEEYLEEVVLTEDEGDGGEEEDEDMFVEMDGGIEEVLVCSYCQASFATAEDLEEHMDTSHEQCYISDKPQPCFVCDECDDSFATKAMLREHLLSEHKMDADIFKLSGRKYECFVCSKRFETPSKLSRHMHVHRDVLDVSEYPKRPPAPLKHECHICQKRVETPSKLQRHLRVHEKRSNAGYGINQHRPLACDSCDLRFWDTVRLERHQIIHSDSFERSKIHHPPGHVFICVYCLEKIPDYEECINHMKGHRDDIGDNVPVSCRLCQKTYPKLTNLIRHSRAHIENATHQCIHCKKRMGMGDDLIDHMLRHEGFKPFLCPIMGCGKRFMKHHKLKQHSVAHDSNAPKPYACNLCDKTFAEADYLKRHELRHSGRKDHSCNMCPSRFAFKTGLIAHMATHRTQKDFSCGICESKFNSVQSLRMHQKIHTGEKKHTCDLCDMKFISHGHLTRHKLTHTGVKPHKCGHCGKSYTQSNDLMKHMKSHYGPNIYKCDIEDCSAAYEKFHELKSHKQTHFKAEIMEEDEVYGEDLDDMKLI